MKYKNFMQSVLKILTCFIFHTKARRFYRQKLYHFFGVSDYCINRRKYNIGEFSYIGNRCRIANRKETSIGKYCSISHEVQIGLSQHPVDTLTTHGFITNKKGECSAIDNLIGPSEENRVDFSNKVMPPVNIGNDVWIGYRAMIMDGVNIGNGAIIAAGAVVTKDIPPYEIWGGVPAKAIGKRFSRERERGIGCEAA